MKNTALAALLFAASLPAFADPGAPGEAVGLYPLQLPPGQEALQEKLATQLHDGASSLPRLRAFDLIPRGSCLADEGGCLAAAARSARLTRMVSGEVDATNQGYRFLLRLFDAEQGAQLGQRAATVVGGPLDLAGALENGVCELLGGAPCVGQLVVRPEEGAEGTLLLVDGRERGRLTGPLSIELPVGRHVVQAGSDERRVRISYHREQRLLCALRGGQAALLDDVAGGVPAAAAASAPAQAVAPGKAPELQLDPRTRAGRLLVAGGAALLMAAGGLELFARVQSSSLDARYQSGRLSDSDKPVYGQVQAAGTAALIVGAAGLGSLAVGGVVLMLSPGGAGVQGRF